MRDGADDYPHEGRSIGPSLRCPRSNEHVKSARPRAERRLPWRLPRGRSDTRGPPSRAAMLGRVEALGRAAASDAPVPNHGRTGTGKELRRARHPSLFAARRRGPSVPVNLSALQPPSSRARLFGQRSAAPVTGAEGRAPQRPRFERPARHAVLDAIGGPRSLMCKPSCCEQAGRHLRARGRQRGAHESARLVARRTGP